MGIMWIILRLRHFEQVRRYWVSGIGYQVEEGDVSKKVTYSRNLKLIPGVFNCFISMIYCFLFPTHMRK